MSQAHNFLHPDITVARNVVSQMNELADETRLTGNGATKFAQFAFTLNAEATLATMERFVKEKALDKAFGDGVIFDAIPDSRTADVSFYRFPDGSGISVAKIEDNSKAMEMLWQRLSFDEMDLMPKAPKFKPSEAPNQMAKLQLADGQSLQVEVTQKQAPFTPRSVDRQSMGSMMPLNASNPLAIKEFLLGVSKLPVQAAPMPNARDLLMSSIMAATSDAHPDNASWPEGVKVVDRLSGNEITSPKAAFESFDRALNVATTGNTLDRQSVLEKFKARRAGEAAPEVGVETSARPKMR